MLVEESRQSAFSFQGLGLSDMDANGGNSDSAKFVEFAHCSIADRELFAFQINDKSVESRGIDVERTQTLSAARSLLSSKGWAS